MVKNGRIECRIDEKSKIKLIKKLKEANLTLTEFIELIANNPIAIIKDVRQRFINKDD
jgi:antitoxin component of RelBE/YafQ-DinJ toxin-antitoxin module